MAEENSGDGEDGIVGKIVITAVVIVLAVPGLIIEPGPFSEIAAFSILYPVWFGGKSGEEAAEDVAENAAGA